MKLQNSLITLIDADSIVHGIVYRLKEIEDVEICINMVDTYVNTILSNTNCTYYLGFLGESKTFRHDMYPEYKSKRKPKEEHFIKWEPIIRFRLISEWKFKLSGILEAEDCVSICCNYYKDKCAGILVAHIDKDLNNLGGGNITHYNFTSHTFWHTDKLGHLELYTSGKSKTKKLKGAGLKWQYAQIITGDGNTDNIPGLVGKGAKFAYDLLHECTTEAQLFIRTYKAYLTYCKEKDIKEYFKLQWSLIVMLTEEAHGFVLPELIEYKKEENTNLDDILKDWI